MRLRAPAGMRSRVTQELAAAGVSFAAEADGWHHLERAHILAQPWAWDHIRIHAAMLHVALRRRDGIEVRGQLVRLVVAGPGSLVSRYPVGNTGRARVAALAPMPIADADVREALAASGQPIE